jgi:hypothetical protein
VITKYQHKVTDCQRSKRITRNKKRGRGGHYRVQIYGASLFGTRASYYRKDLLRQGAPGRAEDLGAADPVLSTVPRTRLIPRLAQTPQVSQAIISERELRPGRVGVGIQGAVERVRLDRRRRVEFRPEPGPGRSVR